MITPFLPQLPAKTMTYRFRQEFERNTTRKTKSERGRLFARYVTIQIGIVNSGEIRIQYIAVHPCSRKHGYASECLGWLCELADAYNVKLCLTPCSMDTINPGMNLLQLTAWYSKFGFVRLGLNDEMVRYPTSCSA